MGLIPGGFLWWTACIRMSNQCQYQALSGGYKMNGAFLRLGNRSVQDRVSPSIMDLSDTEIIHECNGKKKGSARYSQGAGPFSSSASLPRVISLIRLPVTSTFPRRYEDTTSFSNSLIVVLMLGTSLARALTTSDQSLSLNLWPLSPLTFGAGLGS